MGYVTLCQHLLGLRVIYLRYPMIIQVDTGTNLKHLSRDFNYKIL
jgi:hypothetical protein